MISVLTFASGYLETKPRALVVVRPCLGDNLGSAIIRAPAAFTVGRIFSLHREGGAEQGGNAALLRKETPPRRFNCSRARGRPPHPSP